jgi:hypothetical protein
MSCNRIIATRGSDIRLACTWRDGEGNPINMTDVELVILDAPAALEELISVEITQAEAGKFEVFIEGTDPIGLGVYRFRVQRNEISGDSKATPLFEVKII